MLTTRTHSEMDDKPIQEVAAELDISHQALSERRANAVKNLLMSYSVNGQRITTVGMGEYQPKVANSSAENRQQNRRVELSIQPITN